MTGRKLSTSRVLASAGFSVCALALCSCAVGPNYHRPAVPTPTAFKRANTDETPQPVIPSQWWTLFNDAELTALAEKTIAANYDIKAAIARVDQSRASLKVSRADYYPNVALEPSFRRGRSPVTTFTSNGTSTSQAGSTGTTGSGTTTAPGSGEVAVGGGGKTTNTYSVPFTLSYELDLWGRVRRAVESAKYTELASERDLEFVRQTAVADVAQAYFNIRLYDTQIAIYKDSLDLFQKQLDLTQTKLKAGLALQTDVLQAQTQVNSAKAQVIEVQRSRAKQEHAIAILLGETPETFSIPVHSLATAVPKIPAGLPATLLNQRPDVAEAEARLAAANAEIGVVKAAFFPTFSLTGSAGWESSQHEDLISWGNRVWSIAPSVNLPIFEGGRLAGTYEQRKGAYRELLADYQSSVINAYKDVEDELSDLHLLAQKSDALDATVASAKEYSRLTELQYRQGITAYLQVIDANQTLLTNQLAAAQAVNQRLVASVLLIKALGGGWNAPAK
jgi:multidrug efflux system outer membrane protein